MKRILLLAVLCGCAGARPIDPARAGQVRFDSSPSGATVFVDGELHGRTPETVALEPGDHETMIESPGFVPVARRITVTRGQTETWSEPLQRQQRAPDEPASGEVRSHWVARVSDKLPDALCDADYFKACFDMTRDQCLSAARAATLTCMRGIAPNLPGMFDEHYGQLWGGTLGSCAGAQTEAAMQANKTSQPECSDAAHWLHSK